MNRSLVACWRVVVLLCLFPHAGAQNDLRPSLSVRSVSNQSIELSWPRGASGYAVEQANSLTPPVVWQGVNGSPGTAGGNYILTLPLTDRGGFYRLVQRGGAPSARIASTSPLPGETGVAVTRETIFRFDSALAGDVTLGADQVYAEFGGRRILARVALSPDRRTATLFFLENLPPSALVRVTFDGSGLRDANNTPLDLDRDGAPGGKYLLSFTTAGTAALPSTGVIGHVYASEKNGDGSNKPLRGVTVTVDGAEETLRAVTDTNGFFRLQPAPAGRFFVHVDGRTAAGSQWPSGAYYPFVGKAWDATPGQTNNLAGGSGEVFLPLIQAEALKAVSITETTIITFPESVLTNNPTLAGVTVTVPSNTLFSENGTRGGSVGIAPVPADRLPEPLPPGLNLPLVITIQTDGPQNFDRPVPVRFPNLPDPVTGVKLGPGEKTVLWSFNHDTGHWEPQGTMTITSDGNFAETDPGVGVLQPGWHGNAPGSGGGGPCDTTDCEEQDEEEEEEEEEEKDCEDENANGICDEDDAKRCETDKLKTVFSGVDCFANFIPQPDAGPLLGCVASASTAGSQAYRDCAIDPSGCNETKAIKGVETIVDCAVGFIPLGDRAKFIIAGAKQLKCLLDTGIAYETWQLCKDAIPPGGPPLKAQAAGGFPTSGNPFLQQYELESSMGEYFVALFGSEKWKQFPADDWPIFAGILGSIRDAVNINSAGGATVVAEERGPILDLPRPEGIEIADVGALITHLTGGGLDFPRLEATSSRVARILTEVQGEGWRGIYDGYGRGMALLVQASQASGMVGAAVREQSESLAALQAPSTGRKMPRRALFYRITDTRSGFEMAGRLNSRGLFNNVILRPTTPYVVTYFDPVTLRSGSAYFVSAVSGQRTLIPSAVLALPPALPDTDGDGLSDLAEETLGSDPTQMDSDGDGLSDSAEVLSGSNPMDGLGLFTGVVGSTSLGGTGRDIAIIEDHAVVAMESGGLQIVSLRNPIAPARVGSISLQGRVISVAADGNTVVAGNDSLGLLLLDASIPSTPVVRHTISMTGIGPVAVQGNWAYAGTETGNLIVANTATGIVRSQYNRVRGATRIEAIAADGDWLYVLSNAELVVLRQENGLLFPSAGITISGTTAPLEIGRKLLVAGNRLYAGYFQGFSIFDISNPLTPTLLGKESATQAAIHHLTAAGPRLLTPVTSFGGTGTLAFSLYNVSDPSDVTQFLTSFDTPGQSRAAAIHRGLAYVADGPGGIAVVNFVTASSETTPPEVALSGPWSLPSPRTEPGALLRVPVAADDNTLVREVSLLLDGRIVARDGGYPFEFTVRAPAAEAGKTGFALQSVASDFMGLSRTSAPVVVSFGTDATPPGVISVFPPPGSSVPRELFTNITVAFDEALSSVPSDAFRLFGVGADSQPNTADDVLIALAPIGVNGAVLSVVPATALTAGDYFIQLSAGLADAAGNARSAPLQWQFNVTGSRPALSAMSPSGLLPTFNTTVSNLFATLSLTVPPAWAGEVTFALSAAGMDGRVATADDVAVPVSVAGYEVGSRSFHLRPEISLGIGLYRLRMAGPTLPAVTLDFELKDPRNFWKVDRGGIWSTAGNWTYPIIAGQELVIDRPGVDITTTNSGNSLLLRSIRSMEHFKHVSGELRVIDEATFDALVEVGPGSFSDAAFIEGTFRFRGGLDIRSGSSSNQRMAIHNATLINEGVVRWSIQDIESGGENSMFLNAPGAVFEIGEQADDWLLLSSQPRGQLLNAGVLRKAAGTNEVSLTGVNVQNDGQVIVEAGTLEFGVYRGDGSVEVGPAGTVYLGNTAKFGSTARIVGTGTAVLGPIAPSNLRELTEVAASWEVTGMTRIRGGGARFVRPMDLPTAILETDRADLAIESPARLRALRVDSSLRRVTINAPLNVNQLHLVVGEMAGTGEITVNESMQWSGGSFPEGATFNLKGTLALTPGGLVGPGLLRFSAGSDFALSNQASGSINRSSTAIPAGLLNEGVFTKLGTGTVSILIPLTNSGTIRIAEGVLNVPRVNQTASGEFNLAGGELHFTETGRVTFRGGKLSGAGTIRFPGAIFGAGLAINGELQLPGPGGVLNVVTESLILAASTLTVSTVTDAGAGQVLGRVQLNGRLRVEFGPNFDPAIGSAWTIITSSSGVFSGVETAGLPTGKRVEVEYPEGAGVVIRVLAE